MDAPLAHGYAFGVPFGTHLTWGPCSILTRGPKILSAALSTNSSAERRVKVNLPKLELTKFGGKINRWQEFWDGFCSAVNRGEFGSEPISDFVYIGNNQSYCSIKQ